MALRTNVSLLFKGYTKTVRYILSWALGAVRQRESELLNVFFHSEEKKVFVSALD